MSRISFFNKEIKISEYESDCEKCGLYKTVETPRMKWSGKGNKKFFIVGEAPGAQEDTEKTQFIGETGSYLRSVLKGLGYDLDFDFYKTNALCCRPYIGAQNREPTNKELSCCRPRLIKSLRILKPRVVFLFGEKAVDSYFVDRKKLPISNWVGSCIPDFGNSCWVFPLYHPSISIYNPNSSHIFERCFSSALKEAEALSFSPVPVDWIEKVSVMTDFKDVIELLNHILSVQPEHLAYDYETTGLKPYAPIHKIVSISFSIVHDQAYSFPLDFNNHWSIEELEEIKGLWKEVLLSKKIKKISQNLQMEERWNRRYLGVECSEWFWDTMLCTHILNDNTSTGLKFQVFVKYGYEYGKEIEKYLSADNEGISEINNIEKVDLDKLLVYGGLDSLFTFKLFKDQFNECVRDKNFYSAYRLFHKGALAFCDMEDSGIPVDSSYYSKTESYLTMKINKIEKRLLSSPEAERFHEEAGHEINLDSPKQIQELFFGVMGLPAVRRTKTGLSVDENVLKELNIPFAVDLVEMRKLKKVRDTYIGQFQRETVDNVLYPLFGLNLPKTYRSSSSKPNFHNIPIRIGVEAEIIRKGIIAPEGYRIAEFDYSGIEVCVIACFSRDKMLINQLKNKVDIHGMWCKELGLDKEQKDWSKARFDAKNSFVFPEFYLSYYKSIYYDLAERGYSVPIHKVKKVEEKFWSLYQGVKTWQGELLSFYENHGHVVMKFGHKRSGLMTKMALVNAPIQGTAFHILLWALIELNNRRKKEKWLTKIPGQIHDSIYMLIHESEEDYIIKIVKEIMTEKISEMLKWLIVPLSVECKMSELNGNWWSMKTVEII